MLDLVTLVQCPAHKKKIGNETVLTFWAECRTIEMVPDTKLWKGNNRA